MDVGTYVRIRIRRFLCDYMYPVESSVDEVERPGRSLGNRIPADVDAGRRSRYRKREDLATTPEECALRVAELT